MPTYCYQCNRCGTAMEQIRIVADRDTLRACTCGGTLKRDHRAEREGFLDHPGNWPLLSDAAGVNPDQIPAVTAHAQRHGINQRFAPDGRAIFESPRQRKAYCHLIGFHDRNGGYSDP